MSEQDEIRQYLEDAAQGITLTDIVLGVVLGLRNYDMSEARRGGIITMIIPNVFEQSDVEEVIDAILRENGID